MSGGGRGARGRGRGGRSRGRGRGDRDRINIDMGEGIQIIYSDDLVSSNVDDSPRENKIIIIPKNRTEIDNLNKKDITNIRKSFINHIEQKLGGFNINLASEWTDKKININIPSNLMRSLNDLNDVYFKKVYKNLQSFCMLFDVFSFSGKEEKNYETYKKDAQSKKEDFKQKINKLTTNKTKMTNNSIYQNKLIELKYALNNVDTDVENFKKRYEEWQSNPYKTKQPKLINVDEAQTISKKKLYDYEIRGLTAQEYNIIININIYLRKIGFNEIDESMPVSEMKTKVSIKQMFGVHNTVDKIMSNIVNNIKNNKIIYKLDGSDDEKAVFTPISPTVSSTQTPSQQTPPKPEPEESTPPAPTPPLVVPQHESGTEVKKKFFTDIQTNEDTLNKIINNDKYKNIIKYLVELMVGYDFNAIDTYILNNDVCADQYQKCEFNYDKILEDLNKIKININDTYNEGIINAILNSINSILKSDA